MKKLEKTKYVGYIWMSDEPSPKVLKNEEFEYDFIDGENPFVVEGQLFNGEISFSIKYIDGKYIVNKYNVLENQSAGIEYSEQTYIANFDGVPGMQFRQYWREEPDKFCNNMKVLKPAEFVFVGFTKNKKEE